MATIFNDTFTDTNGVEITSHTSDSGHTWALMSGTTTFPPRHFNNRVRGGNVSTGRSAIASVVATVDGTYSEAIVETLTTTLAFGVVTRGDAAGARGYMAYFAGGNIRVTRIDAAATFVNIGSAYAQAQTAGTHTVRITATGTGATVTLTVTYDGVDVLTVTDTSASRITALGSPGVYFGANHTDTAGTHISSLQYIEPGGGGANTYTFITPKDGKVHQLSGGSTGTATVTATGTYTGTAPDEIRLVSDSTGLPITGYDWGAIDSASSGNFSHSFASVPKGGWYNVEVRDSVSTAGEVSGKVGVGVVVMVDGQSQAWLWFSNTAYAGDSSLTPDPLLRITGKQPANSWVAPSAVTMNAAISCGNALVSALSCPVGLIDGSFNGSGLTISAGGGQWISGGTAGNAYVDSDNALVSAGGEAAATIWIQGEADAGSSVTQANYYTALGQLIALRRGDVGDANHPYVMVTLARNTSGAHTDAQREAIKMAQVQKCADAEIYRVDRQDLPLHTDNVHHTATGFATLGQRCARAVLAALGEVATYRGPRIASVAQTATLNVFDVTLTHDMGTDFTPSTGITGFRVTDAGAPATISSAVRQSANVARVTLSATPSVMPVVQYLYGTAPTVTDVLKDNGSLTLPLEYNSGVTASAYAVTIEPPLLTNSQTFYSPSVSTGAVNVQPGLLNSSATLFAPVVTQGGGAPQTVEPPLLTNASTLFAPVVSGGKVLQAPLIDASAVVYAPAITVGGVEVLPPLLNSAAILYAPVVSQPGAAQTIEAPLLVNVSVLFGPSVVDGVQYPVASGRVLPVGSGRSATFM